MADENRSAIDLLKSGATESVARWDFIVAMKSESFGVNTSPGLVQNWPEPMSAESIIPFASDSERSAMAVIVTKTGLRLPISAKTGIGSLRVAARLTRILPTISEPVKPTALMSS